MDKNKKSEKGLGKLTTYCKNHIPVIVIALIAAIIGTILSLFGPDKLSEMTDVMTAGLMGNIDMDKISDDDLARFDIDRNFTNSRDNYEDLGYTCR